MRRVVLAAGMVALMSVGLAACGDDQNDTGGGGGGGSAKPLVGVDYPRSETDF